MRGVGGCYALVDTLEVDLKICVGSESLKLSECFMVENEIHVEEALSGPCIQTWSQPSAGVIKL